MKEFIITKDTCGRKSYTFIASVLPNAGKSFLYKMMRKKNITLNDKKFEGHETLKIGDSIKFYFSDETFDKFAGVSKSYDLSEYFNVFKSTKVAILYEDEDFLIVNKPGGMLSQKDNSNKSSLNEWILGYLLDKGDINEESLKLSKPSICNRLDMNTSGIVLAGKTIYGLNILSKGISERSISKYYHTYVLGHMEGQNTIIAYHHKDEKNNKAEIITEDKYLSINNKSDYTQTKTGINVLGHIFINNIGKELSYLEVDLITGKSHQIRAQLAAMGHPLVGDDKYGNRNINNKLNLHQQLLHSAKIVFPRDDVFKNLSGKTIVCDEPDWFGDN